MPKIPHTKKNKLYAKLKAAHGGSLNFAQSNMLMWYMVSLGERYKTVDRKNSLAICKEIGELTNRIPMYLSYSEYKIGELKKAVEIDPKLKLINADEKNNLHVTGYDKEFTPLKLLALYYFLMNAITGGQLERHFDFVRNASIMNKGARK
jgi:hypothetical protein